MNVLNHHFIRPGPTGAKALPTARRLPRETRRRSAVPKSKAVPWALIGKNLRNFKFSGIHGVISLRFPKKELIYKPKPVR